MTNDNKKELFIYSEHRQYTLWLMHLLYRELNNHMLHIHVYDEFRGIIETNNCRVRLFHDAASLDYLRENNIKADEVFNFPKGSWNEFRKESESNPWRDSALEYIVKTESDAVEISRKMMEEESEKKTHGRYPWGKS